MNKILREALDAKARWRAGIADDAELWSYLDRAWDVAWEASQNGDWQAAADASKVAEWPKQKGRIR